MGDSSDSEEFYDAEEFTPTKGSKRSSLCKSTSVTESSDVPVQDKTKITNTDQTLSVGTSTPTAEVTPEDDRNSIKNVVQGRRRFQELRRCMQTEEDDEGIPELDNDQQTYTLEHPFKVIAHDTMSLQSMTSLGRIGRILSGAAESQPNIRDSTTGQCSSREPSTISDDPVHTDCRTQNDKLHGSQSLSRGEGDDVSICTTDTDEIRYVPRRAGDIPGLDSLVVEPPPSSSANQSMALPSPASTIESLTREFQDSLELSQSKYASDRSSPEWSGVAAARPRKDSTLDIKHALRGEYVVKPSDDDRVRSSGSRTHSESRTAPTTGHSSLGSGNKYAL